jgi:hypothetical protein
MTHIYHIYKEFECYTIYASLKVFVGIKNAAKMKNKWDHKLKIKVNLLFL